MDRRLLAVILVSIFVIPGCIGSSNNNDEDSNIEPEVPQIPPIPVVSISPSNPTINDEITVTIQWYSAKGGMHAYTVLLDEVEVSNGESSGDLPSSALIGVTDQGTHTVTVNIGEGDNQKSASWTFTTGLPPTVNPVIIAPYYLQLEYPGFTPEFSIEITHPEIELCLVDFYINDEKFNTNQFVIFEQNENSRIYSGSMYFENSNDVEIMVDCGRNQSASKSMPVFVNDPALADSDGDGILDTMDQCESTSGYTSSPTTDHDSDGCYDYTMDDDDDNDGTLDGNDRCIRGEIGWDSSNKSLDFDGDGCKDEDEDYDDDDDNVLDIDDYCLSESFTSTGITDHDSDGCNDITEDNDDDNDGYNDSVDYCSKGVIAWVPNNYTDYDSDGCRDIDEDTDDDEDMDDDDDIDVDIEKDDEDR